MVAIIPGCVYRPLYCDSQTDAQPLRFRKNNVPPIISLEDGTQHSED